MRRSWRSPRSGGYLSGPGPRLMAMITFLIVLAMIYQRARDPATWRWLADENTDGAQSAAGPPDVARPAPDAKPPGERPETIIPAPIDTDPAEKQAAARLFEAVTDKTPLSVTEMPAYWRCMQWARAQSFADLARRARRDLAFVQFWEQPEELRGELVRLRMHIHRVLHYPAPENSLGVTDVYEAWGWTDDSKSFPYVVVFSELPPGMKVGPEAKAEGVFVGYFLKTMAYQAFDVRRAAPLMVGRMQKFTRPGGGAAPPLMTSKSIPPWLMLLTAAFVVYLALRVWLTLRRRDSRLVVTTGERADLATWYDDTSPPDLALTAGAPPAAQAAAPEFALVAASAAPDVSVADGSAAAATATAEAGPERGPMGTESPPPGE